MNDSSPPDYSNPSGGDGLVSQSSSVLINLTPPQESTTFQLGYLGHGAAFITGDVQVKYAGSSLEERPAFDKLVISFRGIERVDGAEDIELCEQSEVLWGVGAAGTSSTSTDNSTDFPPTNSPFKLSITPDLPVCLHLTSSALEYSLTVELHFSDSSLPPLVRCAPVHLVRTSPPGSLLSASNFSSSSGHSTSSTVSAQDPLTFSVKLPRTVFKRGEPVELVARIEVPTAKAVGDGLRLRTVSAELVRSITVKPVSSTSNGASGEIPSTASDSIHRTVLAHSGKSARFSPSRPIVIRLLLHPPADLACETITQVRFFLYAKHTFKASSLILNSSVQSTIIHSVTFAVVVTVGLFSLGTSTSSSSGSTSTPTSFDAVLSQPITIVPSPPTSRTSRTDKQKEAERDLHADSSLGWSSLIPPSTTEQAESPGGGEGPVPSYVEYSADDPGIPAAVASSSSHRTSFQTEEEAIQRLVQDFERSQGVGGGSGGGTEHGEEEEYDGYEELSIPIANPPPRIDEDVSPPSPSDPSHPEMYPGITPQLLQDATSEEEPMTPPPNDFATLDFSEHLTSSNPLPPSAPSSSAPSSPPPPLSPLSTLYPRPPASPDHPAPPPSLGHSHLPPPYPPPRSPPPLPPRSQEEGMERRDSESSETTSLRDPPPYEQGEEAEFELVRFGVNRRGELVL